MFTLLCRCMERQDKAVLCVSGEENVYLSDNLDFFLTLNQSVFAVPRRWNRVFSWTVT